MAKIVIAPRFGGPEVLEFHDIEHPAPEEGEVLVDIRAAGGNPADWKRYSGHFAGPPSTPPYPVGVEAAGVVSAVGPGVTEFVPGDEVIVYPVSGGYAEQVLAPISSVHRKPELLSFEQASGFMVGAMIGELLLEEADTKAGDAVLVHGAAGGVGLALVQLAQARGVRCVGTASPGRHTRLRELGVEPIEYGPGLLERARELGPFTAAFDLIGTDEAFDVSLTLVPDREQIINITDPAKAAARGVRWTSLSLVSPETVETVKQNVLKAAQEGKLTVDVDRVFSLEEVADAHRYLAEGHPKGKVVLVP